MIVRYNDVVILLYRQDAIGSIELSVQVPLNSRLWLIYVQTRLLRRRLLQVDLHGRTNFRKPHCINEYKQARGYAVSLLLNLWFFP